MLARKEAVHCKKHVPRTEAWVAKQADAQRGRKVSKEVRENLSFMRRGNGSIERVCAYCEADFLAKKPSKNTRFCSRECGYRNRRGEGAAGWKGGPVKLRCTICGSEYERCAAEAKTSSTCSNKCNGVRAHRAQPNKRTKIEIMMAQALESAGIEFIEQYQSPARCTPDFHLPAYNAVVFCDGEYWHSLEKNARRDIGNTDCLISHGYHVFRYMEGDIMLDPDDCVRRLLSHFSSYSADM